MRRRTVLGGLGAAGLASLSGCLGLVGMDEHESSPAGVEESARRDAEYEPPSVDDIVVEEDVGVSVLSETISVTNYKTEYEKAVDLGPIGSQRAAIFIVLTTPQVGVAGRNFNPVEDMSAEEIVGLIEDSYDEMGNITHEENADITVLGETTTRSLFTADATFEGHDLEVDLHVTEAVEAGDDLLVTVGVYPQRARSREEENVVALMENVIEDVDVDANGGDGGDGGNNDSGGGDGSDSEGGDNNDRDDGDSDDSDGSESDGSDGNDSDDGDGPLGTFE